MISYVSTFNPGTKTKACMHLPKICKQDRWRRECRATELAIVRENETGVTL